MNLGGKANNLYRLRERFCVPEFVTLSRSDLLRLCSNPLLLDDMIKDLKSDIFAVRSSANCEDSAESSYAGMFDTVLGVTKSELLHSILKVSHSYNNIRVKGYESYKGIDRVSCMNVIVQEFVNSRISGVCVTKISEVKNSFMLESCYGLGEALVSGKIHPDFCEIDRNCIEKISYKINPQKKKLVYCEKYGGVKWEKVKESEIYAKKLLSNEIASIYNISMEIEDYFGYDSVDIEWCYDKKRLYILQARPWTAYR